MKNNNNNSKNQSKSRNAAPDNSKYCIFVDGELYTENAKESELQDEIIWLLKDNDKESIEVFKLVKQKVKIDIAVKLIK